MENKEIDFSNKELFKLVGENKEIAEQIYSKPYSYWKTVWKKSFSSPTFIICAIILALFFILAFILPIGKVAIPPGTYGTISAPSAEHWFGTGINGEDLWTKVWIGSRTTILFAMAIFFIQVGLGVIIGSIWGYYSRLDLAFIEITRFLTLIPSLILWLVVIFLFGDNKGIGVIIFAVSITNWIGIAALIRTQILITKNTEYNVASKILGSKGPKIIRKNIMPKILPIVIQTCAFAIPEAIAIDSSLAFLGYGFISSTNRKTASLGSILNEVLAQEDWTIYPYLLIVPLVFVGGLSLLFYLMGKVLSDSLDPKTHR